MAENTRQHQHERPDTIVIGLGKTGMSCARFLAQQGESFVIMDSRSQPPSLFEFKQEFPEVPVYLGEFSKDLIMSAQRIIVSPGVTVQHAAIAQAMREGKKVLGDIELFVQYANAPIIAITGSNGKSTVTSLVGIMGECAGRKVKLGGNIGTPALDLLSENNNPTNTPDYYVLELSSFQLETTQTLNAHAAVILNISADHMDRYENVEEYAAAKEKIYRGDGVIVANRDDSRVMALVNNMLAKSGQRNVVTFGLGTPLTDEYGICFTHGKAYLAKGDRQLMAVDDMRIAGQHNQLNALAALALGEAMGLSQVAMLDSLRKFAGLPHRTQWVAKINEVNWYNDSKGTNVGAAVAAINGLPGNKVLIAGGEGKGADFSILRDAVVQGNVKFVVLIGRDANIIAHALGNIVPVKKTESMSAAVICAQLHAQPGDSVLLSPACASFDMFANYEARGDAYMAAVKALTP